MAAVAALEHGPAGIVKERPRLEPAVAAIERRTPTLVMGLRQNAYLQAWSIHLHEIAVGERGLRSIDRLQ
jgi:hypothetical protein